MTCKPDIMPLNVFWSILSKEAVSERNMKLLLETIVYIAVRVTCIITIETVMYIMHCKNTTCIIITASHLHNYSKKQKKQKKTNFMAPFYGWGSTASRLQPLRGGSLLFTIQFPATHIFAAETVNCICAAEVSNCIIATE